MTTTRAVHRRQSRISLRNAAVTRGSGVKPVGGTAPASARVPGQQRTLSGDGFVEMRRPSSKALHLLDEYAVVANAPRS
jgi:hypothetical protein